MKWRKLGRLFDPAQFRLPGNCRAFAQAPQALVCDDFVRIYFSTREIEAASGMYLSHVAYADFTCDFSRVIDVGERPVIDLGKPGCFDEHGIFPMNVLRHGDRIYGYTCGWNRKVSVAVDTAIGLAISSDGGVSFQRLGDGPILAASLHEPFLVADPFVRRFGDTFHMWYIFGTAWKRYATDGAPQRIYKIGHARSADGITWTKDNEGRRIVADRLGEDECQALPTVIALSGRYHMFFCYRQPSDFRSNPSRGYRIGYAYSDDLSNWKRDDDHVGIDVSASGWDSEMMCYPHVFECAGNVYLLYNGNEFGRHGFGIAVLE